MADEVPKYISTAGVSVGPELDTSGIFNQYSQIFGDIEKATRPVAQSLGDQIAKQQGDLAGQVPGFKPGPSIGEASNIYNEAGLASNKLQSMSDADNTIQSFKMQAMGVNPDGSLVKDQHGNATGLTTNSLGEFNEKMKAYSAGMFQTVPAENRQTMQYYLSSQMTMAQTSLLTQLKTKQDNENNFNVLMNNSNAQTDIDKTMALASNTSDPTQRDILIKSAKFKLADLNNTFKQAVTGTNMPLSVAESYITNNKKQFYQSSDLLMASNMPSAEATKYANFILTEPHHMAILGTGGTFTVSNQIKAQVASRLQAEGVTEKQVGEYEKNLHDIALQGRDPMQVAPDIYQKVASYNDSKGRSADNETLKQHLEIDKATASMMQLANVVPYKNLNDERMKLVEMQKNIDPTDPNYSYKYTSLQHNITNYDNIEKLRTNDSGSWAIQTPGYQAALQQHIQDPKGHPQSTLDNYVYNVQKADGKSDSEIRMLPNSTASSVASQLKSFSMAHDYTSYTNLLQQYAQNPMYSKIIYHDIQRAGKMNENLDLIHDIASNPATANNVQGYLAAQLADVGDQGYFKGLTNNNTGNKLTDIKNGMGTQNIGHGDTVDSIEKVMQDQGFLNTDLDSMKVNAAKYSFYLQKSEKMNSNDANTQAAQTVFGHLSGINTFNGSDYSVLNADLMGNPIDNDMTKSAIWYKTNALLTGNNIETPKGVDQRSYQIYVRSKIRVRNNSVDGLNITNGQGDTLRSLDEKGQPVDAHISYGELSDPNSMLRQNIVKDVIKKYGSYTTKNLEKYGDQDIPRPRPVLPKNMYQDLFINRSSFAQDIENPR